MKKGAIFSVKWRSPASSAALLSQISASLYRNCPTNAKHSVGMSFITNPNWRTKRVETHLQSLWWVLHQWHLLVRHNSQKAVRKLILCDKWWSLLCWWSSSKTLMSLVSCSYVAIASTFNSTSLSLWLFYQSTEKEALTNLVSCRYNQPIFVCM